MNLADPSVEGHPGLHPSALGLIIYENPSIVWEFLRYKKSIARGNSEGRKVFSITFLERVFCVSQPSHSTQYLRHLVEYRVMLGIRTGQPLPGAESLQQWKSHSVNMELLTFNKSQDPQTQTIMQSAFLSRTITSAQARYPYL